MQPYSLFLVECLLGFLLLFVSLPVDGDLTDPSLLPFLPTEEQLTARLDPQLLSIANGGRKGGKIPRIIWVAVANASEPLPGPLLDNPQTIPFNTFVNDDTRPPFSSTHYSLSIARSVPGQPAGNPSHNAFSLNTTFSHTHNTFNNDH